MSDSDDDYRDAGLDINGMFTNSEASEKGEEVARQAKVNKNGRKVRGRDISWLDVSTFSTTQEYMESVLNQELKDRFTCMRKRSPDYADTEHFVCKFSRKVGFLPCPLQHMIKFFSHNDEVSVACNDDKQAHNHDRDTNRDSHGVNFHWTSEQNMIILQGVLNEAKPAVIRRNLDNANAFVDGSLPTTQQLNNKIASTKLKHNMTQQIFTTHDLREKMKDKLDIPEDDNKAYIAFQEVLDEDESKEPRFTIIWTSKKMMKRASSEFTQDDATYRLTWQGYPFFVSGVSTPTGTFFPTHCALSSHEDTSAWKCGYKFIRDLAGKNPRFRMGDGASEITKAGEEVKII